MPPLYAVLSGHPPMTPCPMPPRPGRPAALLAAALAVLALASGCALQSEVMEVQDEMATIKSLQKQLEQQIADAQEAAETMRAIGFRMEAVEDKLKEGVNPEVQARITRGLHDLDTALNGLDAKNKAIDERLGEAERFFVARVEEVSGRQQALSSRVTSLENTGLPPEERAARAVATSDLESLKTRAEAQTQSLKRMQEQFALLTDRMAQLQAAQQATQQAATQAAGAGMEKVDLRLANLESGAAKGVQGRQQLADQVAMLTDRIAGLTAGQQAKAQVSETQATALDTRLAAAEKQSADNAAAQAALTQKLTEVSGRMADLAAGQADKAQVSETQATALETRLAAAEKRAADNAVAQAALAQTVKAVSDRMAGVATAQTAGATEATGAVQTLSARLAALEQRDTEAREAQQRLMGQVDVIAQRVGDLVAAQAEHKGEDPAALEARLSKLEGGKGQVERLAQLTDQLTLLGTQVTERLDAQASDFTRLAARLDRIDEGVKGFQEAPPPWGEALDKKVSFLADELTPRVDTQGRELTAMAQTLAKTQEADQQNAAHLSERIDALGTSVVQRVESLDARVSEAEKAADARAKAQVPPDLEAVNKRLDVLGKEMPGRVDDLNKVVGTLRGHLQQMGERIALLETIQKQEAADLRKRFNALSSALAEITGSRAP
jgi:chromosome segregation ATPase